MPPPRRRRRSIKWSEVAKGLAVLGTLGTGFTGWFTTAKRIDHAEDTYLTRDEADDRYQRLADLDTLQNRRLVRLERRERHKMAMQSLADTVEGGKPGKVKQAWGWLKGLPRRIIG